MDLFHVLLILLVVTSTFGFLAPIFFASIGLNLSPGALVEIPLFLFLLIAAAFLGKFIGAGFSAYAVGLPRADAAVVGVGMSARGAVELVIAGYSLGSWDIICTGSRLAHPQPAFFGNRDHGNLHHSGNACFAEADDIETNYLSVF